LQNFPCTDLRTIDQLWFKHSRGKFGFSVQKKIWQSCDSPTYNNQDWGKFGKLVGWRDPKSLWSGWYEYKNYRFEEGAPLGHLPALLVDIKVSTDRGSGYAKNLFSRIKTCKL
jgi:hypothetical protein